MNRYIVRALEVHSVALRVNAETEPMALDVAADLIERGYYIDGTSFPDPEYEYTLDIDKWPPVERIEDES